MLRRLLIGLVLGAIVGGLAAAALVAGLHIAMFAPDTGGAVLAYLTAAVTGVLTGLVAGKPIWASGAKIEAGLKAFFGALLAAGLMFALRQWVHFQPDMAFLMPGVDPTVVHDAVVGNVPALALPAVAAVLGGFFELDNTGGADADEAKGEASKSKKRVADAKTNGKSQKRVADDDESEAEVAAPVAPKRAKR
ncbi:MAG TPA: hypothetical protein VGL81_14700 [Polyangiaceae bacterium]|jgi:hypothetical protein